MVVQQELAEAKEEGLKGVQRFVYNNSNSKKGKYDLMTISAETAGKLLHGEFKTFEGLSNYSNNSIGRSDNIEILYRQIFNENRKEDVYIIETIFINE